MWDFEWKSDFLGNSSCKRCFYLINFAVFDRFLINFEGSKCHLSEPVGEKTWIHGFNRNQAKMWDFEWKSDFLGNSSCKRCFLSIIHILTPIHRKIRTYGEVSDYLGIEFFQNLARGFCLKNHRFSTMRIKKTQVFGVGKRLLEVQNVRFWVKSDFLGNSSCKRCFWGRKAPCGGGKRWKATFWSISLVFGRLLTFWSISLFLVDFGHFWPPNLTSKNGFVQKLLNWLALKKYIWET